MLSVVADKSAIAGIFNSSENTPWIESWHTNNIPKVKCPPKGNPANVLQMKLCHSHVSQSSFQALPPAL